MAAPLPEQGPLDVPFDQYQRYRVTSDLANAAAASAPLREGVPLRDAAPPRESEAQRGDPLLREGRALRETDPARAGGAQREREALRDGEREAPQEGEVRRELGLPRQGGALREGGVLRETDPARAGGAPREREAPRDGEREAPQEGAVRRELGLPREGGALREGGVLRESGPLRVLDVGGHHSDFWGRARRPIADFLPDLATVTLDVAKNPLRGYVRGRGDALPFQAGSFDLVCSVDVLEHVPPAARTHLADELMRVSSRGIILAAPFRHPLVERAEAFVSEFILRTCGYVQGQLREHREYGLPDLAATCRDLSRDGWRVRLFPYGNLWRWMMMMVDKHAVSALSGSRGLQSRLDRRYNETWFAKDRALPCYRYFLVAARGDDDPLLAAAEQQFGAARDPQQVWPSMSDEEAERMFSLLAIHAENQTLQATLEPERRDTHVAELETLRTELYKNLDAVQRENDRLVRLLRDVERSTPYRMMAALKRWLPSGR